MTAIGNGHDGLREALGAYALGQLDDEERQEVEQHLATCDTCPWELAEIRPVAQALREVGAVPQSSTPGTVTVPAGLDERIRRALPRPEAASRRRRRLVGAAAVTAGVAAAAAVAVVIVRHDAGPTVIAVPQVTTVPGVTAAAGLVDHTWGVEVKLRASGLPAGQRFQMWVVADDGTSREAGEFVGVAGAEIVCDMSSSVLLRHATAFRVVDASGREVISADLGS